MQTGYVIRRRITIAFIICAVMCVLVLGRLVYVQLIWGESLSAKALDQWTRDLPLTAQRGDILDTQGKIIATSETVYDVYVRPKSVEEPEEVARVLSDVLQLSYDDVYKKATEKNVSDVTVMRNTDTGKASELRGYSLKGVYLAASTQRLYVYGELLSQVLGYVSSDKKGQAGIESYFDKYLAGTDGAILTPSDIVGKELEGESVIYLPSQKGLNVQLTIDLDIQMAAESILDIAYKAHSPKKASMLVIDVTNGEILAMATKPGVDLNNLPRDDIELLLENTRAVLLTDVYEPGSTFKILTAAANLEEYKNGNPKAVSENYIFPNNSAIRVVDSGKAIKCWTTHANGKHNNQDLCTALKNSCNPIFTDIAISLGTETMYKYIKAFGYGSYTGIDFAGEQAGLLINQKNVTAGDLARIGFGQSITVTALQLAYATAAAVNGGYLYEPRLVKSILDDQGNTAVTFASEVRSRPIREDTSKKIAAMLERVVTEGSGKQAYIEGYHVGGKTGTAQKFENGKLAVGKNVSSFVGFFPATSPKYLALVVVDEPQGMSYGSMVAAPYAKLIFERIIALKDFTV